MDKDEHAVRLAQTIEALLAGDKGLLAMDESTPTCNKRFAALGIAQTPQMRQRYRSWIVATPGLQQYIGGAILFDETIRQNGDDGRPIVQTLIDKGIVPGIKVDAGAHALAAHPGEKVTEGLDGLRARLQEYAQLGARFAKWRAVIAIGDGLPTQGCIDANAHALARYAALCQEVGMVPIVEPEVLMDGDHDLRRCAIVTQATLHAVFEQLIAQRVRLESLLLKPNMVLPGLGCAQQDSIETVADTTVTCLLRHVSAAVPGITFLSGGQDDELASARLAAMNARFSGRLPWVLSFSFARAIQQRALQVWGGDEANVEAAQRALLARAAACSAARRGQG